MALHGCNMYAIFYPINKHFNYYMLNWIPFITPLSTDVKFFRKIKGNAGRDRNKNKISREETGVQNKII
jgi:hypothetical protein